MKRLLSLMLAILILAGCSSPNSSVNVPQNQETQPKTVIQVTATPIPLNSIDLEPMLYKPGDLPSRFVPGQFKDTLPERLTKDIQKPVNFAQVDFRYDNYASDGITILLYESETDRNKAYEILVKPLDKAEVVEIGEKGVLIEKETGVKSTTIVFTRCSAVAYIQLFAPEASTDVTATYARRIDRRIQKEICGQS